MTEATVMVETGTLPAAVRALAPGVWLRPATLDDYDGVTELKGRFGLSTDTRGRWDHLWSQNPLARRTARPTVGWVLEAGAAVVGFLGTIPHAYSWGARGLVAAIATSYVVDEKFRSHSVALASAFFKQPGIDLFVSTTANAAASRVYQAFGARPVPEATAGRVLFWTLRPYRVALAAWRKRGLPAIAAPAGAAIIAAGTSIAAAVRSSRPRATSRTADLRPLGIEELDSSFDDLYDRRCAEGQDLVASRRPEWLRWHFARRAAEGHVRFIAAQVQRRLVGYVVLTEERNTRLGMQRSKIADLFVDRRHPLVVGELVEAAYETARRAGSDVLEVIGFGPDVRASIETGRPFSRPMPSESFVCKLRDRQLAGSIEEAGGWRTMSTYDGDATL